MLSYDQFGIDICFQGLHISAMRRWTLPILRARLTRYRCRKSIELHEKRHRAICMLRDSLLQLVNRAADGIHSGAGLGGYVKTCQTDDSDLLLRRLKGVGKGLEKDQRTDMSSIYQKDSESLVPRWMNANVSTPHSEARDTVKTNTLKGHVSRTARFAENEGICGGLYSSMSSLSEKDNIIRPPIARLNENQPMERKTPKIQNDLRTAEEQRRIHEALHPPPLSLHPAKVNTSTVNISLTQKEIIAANIAFSSATFKYSSLRKPVHQKRIACNNGINKSGTITIDDSQITAILQRLGIHNDILLDRSKKCKSLLARLRHEIYLDLVSVENEERETMMRMAGYWRYVNRRTYNAMVRNNQLWDWATGAKLEELEVNDHEMEDGDEDAQEADSQKSAGVGISSTSERSHHDKGCDTPATRVTEENVIKRVFWASGKEDKSVPNVGSPHKGTLDKSKYSSSDSPHPGIDPKSHWAGIRDTRHLPETPPETPLAHPAAMKHASRPCDNNPVKPLSLRLRSDGTSSMRKPKVRPALTSISSPNTALTKDISSDTKGRVDRPRTSLTGTASYANVLRKGL